MIDVGNVSRARVASVIERVAARSGAGSDERRDAGVQPASAVGAPSEVENESNVQHTSRSSTDTTRAREQGRPVPGEVVRPALDAFAARVCPGCGRKFKTIRFAPADAVCSACAQQVEAELERAKARSSLSLPFGDCF